MIRRSSTSTWARAAISGTTPPNGACSSICDSTTLERIVPARPRGARPAPRRSRRRSSRCRGRSSGHGGTVPHGLPFPNGRRAHITPATIVLGHSGARAQLANPESSLKFGAFRWIPGSRHRPRSARPGGAPRNDRQIDYHREVPWRNPRPPSRRASCAYRHARQPARAGAVARGAGAARGRARGCAGVRSRSASSAPRAT